MADAEAKKAAEGDESGQLTPHMGILMKPLPASIAAFKAQRKRLTTLEWAEQWDASPRSKKYGYIEATPPGGWILKMYKDLPRRSASIITQLRTGHIGLRYFLHRIHAVDSPLCRKCGVPETIQHFILNCRRYCEQRAKLRESLAAKHLPFRLSDMFNSPSTIRYLLKFVHETERFPRYYDKIEPLTNEDN